MKKNEKKQIEDVFNFNQNNKEWVPAPTSPEGLKKAEASYNEANTSVVYTFTGVETYKLGTEAKASDKNGLYTGRYYSGTLVFNGKTYAFNRACKHDIDRLLQRLGAPVVAAKYATLKGVANRSDEERAAACFEIVSKAIARIDNLFDRQDVRNMLLKITVVELERLDNEATAAAVAKPKSKSEQLRAKDDEIAALQARIAALEAAQAATTK